MQRTYKILLRAVSVVFLSAVMFSGNLGKLLHGDNGDGASSSKGPAKIFSAYVTPESAFADAPSSDGSGDQYDGPDSGICGDSCDGP